MRKIPAVWILVTLLVVSWLAFPAFTVAWVYYQGRVQDSRWCATMSLLTSVPVPKPADAAANPSREEGYRLYEDFSQLKGELRCH